MAYDKVVDSAFLEAGLKKVGDSIRAKAGTSELLEFPDAMSAAVDAIDTSEDLDEVLDEQDGIIDQIQAALEGKAAASVETCTVTLNLTEASYTSAIGVFLVLADGSVVKGEPSEGGTHIYTLLKPCIVYLKNFDSISGNYESTIYNYVYVIRGDVTVEGKYFAETGPA